MYIKKCHNNNFYFFNNISVGRFDTYLIYVPGFMYKHKYAHELGRRSCKNLEKIFDFLKMSKNLTQGSTQIVLVSK